LDIFVGICQTVVLLTMVEMGGSCVKVEVSPHTLFALRINVTVPVLCAISVSS